MIWALISLRLNFWKFLACREVVVCLNVGRLGELFARKPDHPLADERELRAMIAGLPGDDAFAAVDELSGWLESLAVAWDIVPGERFAIVARLDEVAQLPLRRLTREYLGLPGEGSKEEKRLWQLCCGFWRNLADAYESCLPAPGGGGKSGEALKKVLPALAVRLLVALSSLLKWELFRHGPADGALWQRLGRALLVAETEGAASRRQAITAIGTTSPIQEFARAMALYAASPDSAAPLQIQLMERLIAHFQHNFEFTAEAAHDCVYWVDLAQPWPPQRLARRPAGVTPTMRFFKPAGLHAALSELRDLLERGGAVPAHIPLGDVYPVRLLLSALRQLTTYLAPHPPQRRHPRHSVRHRMGAVVGLEGALAVFSGQAATCRVEDWGIEDACRGGFGAVTLSLLGGKLQIGSLLALQPEGGDSWLLGVVRRCHHRQRDESRVGVEVLARRATSVVLRPRSATGYAAAAEIRAIALHDGNASGELRLLLPFAGFDAHCVLEGSLGEGPRQLMPVAIVEQGADYEFARYRFMA